MEILKINFSFDKFTGKKKLFGEQFIKNNKNNCSLLINNRIHDLCEYYENNKNKEKILKIQLIIEKPFTNLSYMFFKCDNLSSLPDISKLNTENVTDMNNMFSYCIKLNPFPDISNWNIKMVKDISYMFS